jgi:arsenate reductase
MTKTVLFICIHNSARSQIAEALVNDMSMGKFVAESAGLEPGQLNPIVVAAMAEVGLDISKNRTKSVVDFLTSDRQYDFVITVCDEASGERCPNFPGSHQMHWSFPDPASLRGTDEEKLAQTRFIRDAIRDRVLMFLETGE